MTDWRMVDAVIEQAERVQGAPFGFLRQVLLRIDGAPPIDITYMAVSARDIVEPYLTPLSVRSTDLGFLRIAKRGAKLKIVGT